MSSARRLYTYLVSAISLQAVTWAIIALLRNLIIFGIDREAVAFQVAVIIIGLPVFLVHWITGQRSVESKSQEQGSTLRRLYLYGNLAAFLGPFAANLFDLIRRFFGELNELQSYQYDELSTGNAILYHLLAMLIVGILWFYHFQVTREDTNAVPDEGGAAIVRRFYVYGFATAGLYMTSLAVIHLIRWVMLQFGSTIQSDSLNVILINEIDRIFIGIPLWIIFWRWAQSLYEGPKAEERNSALRKFYLYGVIFVSAMNVVIHCSLIIYKGITKLLDVYEPSTQGLSGPVPILIGTGILWWYHAFVIREDAKTDETTRQAGVRRLYAYLIAAIGLSALLIGLGGIFYVLINLFGSGFGSVRDELAWAIAAIITGLPTWLIPWRQMQILADDSGPSGVDARNSSARRIYLYFFLFIATMTALSSAVFIVYRIIDAFLGGDSPTIIELAEALSYIIIAVGVWLYHGSILRSDRRLAQDTKLQKLQELKVAAVDEKDGQFGHALVAAIQKEIPELEISPIWLSAEKGSKEKDVIKTLQGSGLIVGSWEIAVPNGLGGKVTPIIAQTIATSSAHKLLTPTRREGWDWAGIESNSIETLATQTAAALQQILEGEPVKIRRTPGVGTIIVIVIAVLIILAVLPEFIDSIF